MLFADLVSTGARFLLPAAPYARKLQGEVDDSAHATRGVCYCRDCRAFAYYLGPPEGMLDALGGTDVVSVRPRHVRFTQGVEHLACMSLTEKGMLRWYAACCRTPVGNTPRDMKISHVGLVHSALSVSGRDLGASFASLLAARVTGSYRINPFFNVETGAPRAEPAVLSAEQRAELMRAVQP